jgi:toxin ParE1/3/4
MAKFFLTRRANIDLLDIEEFSFRKWGENQTEKYINELYQSFAQIAKKPEVGKLRKERSFPFYMMSVKQHFVIYKIIDTGIIIATILHGRRNIENIVRNMSESLADEIQNIENSV